MSKPHLGEENEILVHRHSVFLDREPFALCLFTLLVVNVQEC